MSMQTAVGLLVFSQFWFWYPLCHFLSLALTPTAVIALNADLKVRTIILFCYVIEAHGYIRQKVAVRHFLEQMTYKIIRTFQLQRSSSATQLKNAGEIGCKYEHDVIPS